MIVQDYSVGGDDATLRSAPFHQAVVAIGNFDGMHRGHQELLLATKAQAERMKRSWGLVTFEPHPRNFFNPQQPIFRLTPEPLKAKLASALGADFVLNLNFNKDLASLEPDQFVLKILVGALRCAHVVVGYDFHFGKDRKGAPETLQELGGRFGFAVTIVSQVADDDHQAPYSSSAIRQALQQGRLDNASQMLGYHWMVMGTVVKGDQRGRQLGFPTANLVLSPGCEPLPGIYAVRVRDLSQPQRPGWQGAAYFGSRPTFQSKRTFLEIYLFDMNETIYDHALEVTFVELLRQDQQFDTVEALIAQVQLDCTVARQRLDDHQQDEWLSSSPLGSYQAQGLL